MTREKGAVEPPRLVDVGVSKGLKRTAKGKSERLQMVY